VEGSGNVLEVRYKVSFERQIEKHEIIRDRRAAGAQWEKKFGNPGIRKCSLAAAALMRVREWNCEVVLQISYTKPGGGQADLSSFSNRVFSAEHLPWPLKRFELKCWFSRLETGKRVFASGKKRRGTQTNGQKEATSLPRTITYGNAENCVCLGELGLLGGWGG